MKQLLIYLFASIGLLSCSENHSPKTTVKEFVTALKKLDFEKAQTFITEETKPVFTAAKTQLQNSSGFQDALTTSKTLTEKQIVDNYGLDNLVENITDKNTIVQRQDSSNQIKLEKVEGSWKIVCSKKLVDGILLEADNQDLLNKAYQFLQQQYQRRADLITNIISTTPTAEANAIKQKISETKSAGGDISNLLTYNTKQKELSELISAYLQSANTPIDLKIQLDGTENRIAVARRDFNEAAFNYNSGFGKKVDMLPYEEVKPVKVEF